MGFDDAIDGRSFYFITPGALLPEIRRNGAKLLQRVNPSAWTIETGLGGDDLGVDEYLELGETHLAGGAVPFLSRYTTDVRCYFDADANGGSDCRCGLQIGTLGAGPPFPTHPTSPVLQVHWQFNDGSVRLLSAKGDGSASGFTVKIHEELTFGFFMRMLWEPLVPRCRVWQGPTLVADQTDPAVLPDFTIPCAGGIGFYAYSGPPSFVFPDGSAPFAQCGPIRVSYLDSLNAG